MFQKFIRYNLFRRIILLRACVQKPWRQTTRVSQWRSEKFCMYTLAFLFKVDGFECENPFVTVPKHSKVSILVGNNCLVRCQSWMPTNAHQLLNFTVEKRLHLKRNELTQLFDHGPGQWVIYLKISTWVISISSFLYVFSSFLSYVCVFYCHSYGSFKANLLLYWNRKFYK